jgi:D-arabinose 1-dehydrogenase-like Zn-dependent alcohol dehydrogenase
MMVNPLLHRSMRDKPLSRVFATIDCVVSFAEFRDAYARLKSGNHVGRVVIETAS